MAMALCQINLAIRRRLSQRIPNTNSGSNGNIGMLLCHRKVAPMSVHLRIAV